MSPPDPLSIILSMASASLLSKYILSCLSMVDSIVDIPSPSAVPSGSQILYVFLNKPENTHPARSKLVLSSMPFLSPGPVPDSPSFRIRKQCSESYVLTLLALLFGTDSLGVTPTHASHTFFLIISRLLVSGAGRGDTCTPEVGGEGELPYHMTAPLW